MDRFVILDAQSVELHEFLYDADAHLLGELELNLIIEQLPGIVGRKLNLGVALGHCLLNYIEGAIKLSRNSLSNKRICSKTHYQ